MEQKKTLWIIAAVSVFLLVVVGGAALIFNQNLGSTKRTASTFPVEKTTQAQAQTQTSSGWTNTSVAEAQTSSPTVNDMFVVSENTTVLGFNQSAQSTEDSESTTIDLNALKKELAANAAVSQPQNINITVNLSEAEKQAKVEEPPVVLTSEYYVKSAKEAEASEKAAAVKQTQSVSVAKTEPAKTTASSAASSTGTKASSSKTSTAASSSVSTKTATANTAKANPITRFWVQVAAYSNKKTAENARSVLSEKKINSDIYTYEDNKSKLFYRVRVGPFTTKSEAEYWQSKITEISDFAKAGSYVTSTVN